ncbi:MAG: maleylpyruvate isomerase N-terminal domain-containing protein, partial [Jiangellaceae bacterium]
MTHVRAAYVEAADSAVVLLSDPAVARAWDQPSALAEFGVSGLAGHLAAQIFNVPKVLALDVPTEPPIPLLEHYARARWIDAALDDDANVDVRRSGEDTAVGGQANLVERART